MKTKKQLAAAAAAAAATAKAAASTSSAAVTATISGITNPPAGNTSSSTSIAIKKPLKRLQSKAKESPSPNSAQPSGSAGPTPQPVATATTAKAKPTVAKSSIAVPKAPPTKHDTDPTKATKPDTGKAKKPSAAVAGGKKPSASAAAPKKIQKELKNLGITDRAINQIDTATVECNPSISEMVKTKSRATVSQLKYSELGGGTSSLGGPIQAGSKPVTTACSSKEPPSDAQKPVEPSGVTSSTSSTVATVVSAPAKKRPPPKTKDTTAAKDDTKTQQDVPREEGGAKNKTPVTASPTPSIPAMTAANPAKEDVKAPPPNVGSKGNDSKTKAKRPESKNDNDGAEQKSSPAKKNPPTSVVLASKPKPKSKKAILEEKRAAEAAAKVAAAEQAAAAAALELATKQAEDKQKLEEEKTCSLELDPDDKHESDVQSRIEDIVKALEESDEDEGPPMLLLPPSKPDERMVEPPTVSKAPESAADADTKEKKQTKVTVTTKPKAAASKKKAAPKKKPIDDKSQDNDKALNTPATDSSSGAKQESPSNESKTNESIKTTPAVQAKRKNVRKPAQTTKKKVEPKKAPQATVGSSAELNVEAAPPITSPAVPSNESQKLEKTTDLPVPVDPTEFPDPPKTIRSSTENDDDVPLNRLKDKVKGSQPPEATPENFTIPASPASTAAPLLAGLLSATPTLPKSKRKYVRKTPTTPASGSKKKISKAASNATDDAKDKKPEKKDVYDFDDSESENDAPVKAGKPFFKRKPVETSSAKEEDDTEDQQSEAIPSDPLEPKNDQDPLQESESDSEEEKDFKIPQKKSTKPTPRVRTPKDSIKELSSNSEESDDDDKVADPDERPMTPMSKKIKREVRDSSEESNASDSSEESVRTRIVKKHLSAKTRHLKLYGFWSGPKRHRVASLNAIAKVHCLYENETRAALEASLMKQGPPRAKAGTSKEVKKEKIEENERKEEVKEEKHAEKKEESEVKKQKEEKVTKEEKKKPCKKTDTKEVKKKDNKKVAIKEEKKDDKKKVPEKQKHVSESESESEESSEEEVVTRTLRCVPGLRGAGKHWDPNASSMESEGDVLPDSDETYAQGKDTDPVKKRKVKRKVVKKAKPKQKADKPKAPVKKIKKETKATTSDTEKQEDESSESESESEKAAAPAKPKTEDSKKRKREPKEKKEIVESTLGKKRMASLNATAMLAATYEVQRILYRNTDSDSDSPVEKPKAKKVKDQKETKEQKEAAKKEAKEQKQSKEEGSSETVTAEPAKSLEKEKSKEKEKEKDKEKEKEKPKEKDKEKEMLVTVKTEPNRERREELEVKREIEEPRPVSSNLVIAQDTEVTITGVYVNSSLGANQEAYCKMQYRVQQSVTEERLVRPGEAPPKSYTPLTALSSMRPPNDQTLSTPPLFGPPSQCDSPLGLGPRAFYPPPTSSSGSSSAFCAPIPHGSPGYYQPAGPLISPHLLAQPIPVSQHGPGGSGSSSSSTITKQPPESDSPGVSSLVQPPSSSTADSTDSDVLLTAGDLSSRPQPYRYGPSGPPNLYPRPVQMHCPPPPPHLAPNYYAAPPYSQYPPEMYYTHAYPPAHFYPKFAQYYPSRRYYPAPPGEHLYEQPPPPSSAPVPPPSGAQLVPAGPPQGPPQHLEHYPGPPYPYPGYGSPGPGPGGQCYSRNLQPPPYLDAHYTTNCPCPMQSCPKNVNAGSLIGIKASKGPVTTATPTTPNQHHNHIVSTAASIPTVPTSSSSLTAIANNSSTEPIMISSGSSTSSSPPPLDIHSPIAVAEPVVSSTVTTTASAASPAVTSVPTSLAVTVTTNTTTEPNTTPKVKPESDLHQYNSNIYHPHQYHYHHQPHPHRPSAPPPTHPLHSYNPAIEVKQEPSALTLETADSKTTKNIPKLLPLVKQEITEVKQEPQPVTIVTCKKEDFEENGPAMTPDLLLDEALIKKEALVTELLLPDHHQHHRCFAENQKLDDKSLLSDILTAETNLITSKTTGSDSCSNNISSNNQNNNNSSSISNEKVQLVDSILPEIPASTVKRRPLLVACKKSTPKKSPPNSYKNLIKRTNLGGDGETEDEPTITVLSDDDDDEEDDEDEVVVTPCRKPKRKLLLTTKPRKLLKRTRRVFGAEQLRHLQKLNRSVLKSKRIRRIVKRPSCVPRNPTVPPSVNDPPLATTLQESTDAPLTITIQDDERVDPGEVQPPEERPRPMSNVDLTIDLVAKGYFSEPEIITPEAKGKSRLLKKLKQQEGRSQSEQNRGKRRERSADGKSSSKKAKKLEDPLDIDFDKRKNKCKAAAGMESVESEELKKQTKAKQPKNAEPKEKKPKKEPKKRVAPKTPKHSGKKRATSTPLPPEVVIQPEANPLDVSIVDGEPTVDDRETDFDDAATMLVDDDVMSVDTNTMINRHNNNNNNSAVENKNATVGVTDPLEDVEDPLPVEPSPNCAAELTSEERLVTDEEDEEEEIMLARRFTKKSATLKRTSRSRSKSKSRKFCMKKRHRVARVTEVEEIIVPRKCNSIPRWSNGWTWEGQPFQGKVFLNSDDPPVSRTCYPAMRHSEGDIIKPRDSVLLRAGSKRAELPYVAKVAHLWENPEDGEMMMSLLWYYRPEHTEQGRQLADGPDEVFASRHKDHNSVACIEDKCYVLTFSEYCRFRRQLRGLEENIEEQPSIVPPLRRENPRLPPPIVSPELVMYCQRVYEFRLKRLLKQPS